MVDIGLISGAMTAFKAARQTATTLIGVHDAAVIKAKVTELNTQIADALESAVSSYSDQLALLKRVDDLEKEVADFKTWENEKERYELKKIDSGAYIYMLKVDAPGAEPPHWLCATCYQNRKKFILQPFVGSSRGKSQYGQIWVCPACKAEIDAPWEKGPGSI